MKFELVVFDLAGTTVKDNKDVHRVLQNALKKHGVTISIEDANAVMGIPKPDAIRELLEKRCVDKKKINDVWITEIHRQFVQEMILFYERDPSVGEKEGVSDSFRKLREKGIKVAVDTGFDRPITAPLLTRLGWLKNNLIDCSVTSDEVSRGRPHPDLIFEAMRRIGIADSKKVIKVGDTASDMREGKAAGCGLVVGITSGAFSAELLKEENPDHLIEKIPQLLDLIH